jgi:hypothetical protein
VPETMSLNDAMERIDESLEREVPMLFARAMNYSGPLTGDPAPHWRRLAAELRRLATYADEAADHA